MNENLINIDRTFISRSAILEHFTCPYKHYLTYWATGPGLHPNRHDLSLLIGTMVHRGLQHLFEHCRLHEPNEELTEACVDEAVEVTRELWLKELAKKGISLKSSAEYNRLDWILAEQECLWEGLIRAFAIYRLPRILEEYDILEVEKEEVYERFSPISNIVFLGKADGLFLRKSDKALVVLSIKTTSEYAEVTTRNILHDMQGVSETFLTQERLGRYYKLVHAFCETFKTFEGIFDFAPLIEAIGEPITENLFKYMLSCWHTKTQPKIFGVQYEYLIKGKRRQEPQNSGEYRQQSFLCHPMKLDAIRKIMLGKSSSVNPAQYKWKWGSGKQPKGWEKTDIWNDLGIKNWINLLATGQVQPELGHPFENILNTPDLIVRSENELKEWLVSTKYLAEEIKEKVTTINEIAEEYDLAVEGNLQEHINRLENEIIEMVWRFFPKNTLNCHDYFGGDCHFVSHCHELESVEDMIIAESLIKRIPHHELEKKDFIEKGLIKDDK